MSNDAASEPDTDEATRGLEMLLRDADIWRSRILITAAELDVFSILERGMSEPSEIADALNTHPEATARLLCALQEMGYLRRENGSYSNTLASSMFLVRGSAYYLGSWLRLQGADWRAWAELTETVTAGRPPAVGSIFADPARLGVLLEAAHDRARIFHVERVLAELDLHDVQTLLDIGGGVGSYALAFCEKYPQLACTIFDLPAAIAISRDVVGAHPCRSQITFRAGDFHQDDVGGPFDAAFMSNVLHGEDAKCAEQLIRKVRGALRPGGRLIIRDSFLGDDGTNSVGGATFSLVLMIETAEGRTHRLRDVQAMMRAAGFVALVQPNEQMLVGWLPAEEV